LLVKEEIVLSAAYSDCLENEDFITIRWALGKKHLKPVTCAWSLQRKGLILMEKVHCCASGFHPAILPAWHNSIGVNFTPCTVNSSVKKVCRGISEDVIYKQWTNMQWPCCAYNALAGF